MKSPAESFKELRQKYNHYDSESYNFIYESLDYTLRHLVKDKREHVSAHELLNGCKRYAINQFGCLAKIVLNTWGINTTNDIGEMVFQLVEHDLLGSQESDRIEYFNDVYDFAEVFNVNPVFSYNPDKNEWKADYVQRKEIKKKKGNA